MPRPDETFIVRVRARDGDAIVEQPRLARRHRITDVADVGALITRWLGVDSRCPSQTEDEKKEDE
jgi:hypothetical protein